MWDSKRSKLQAIIEAWIQLAVSEFTRERYTKFAIDSNGLRLLAAVRGNSGKKWVVHGDEPGEIH
jgi:hypothetical protein